MAPQSKLGQHPDINKIISWLKIEGISVRDAEKRLAQMYPRKDQEHLRVSFSTIQAFKKDHLNLEGQLLKDIKDNSKLTKAWAKKTAIGEELAQTSAYKEVLQKIAENELDSRKKILQVFAVIEARLQKVFDQASKIDFIDKDVENILINYLKQLQSVIDQHKKYEEGYREQVDVNINVNVMTQQIEIMRDAVRDTLKELDPEITLKFMGKLNEKMKKLALGTTAEANKHAYLLDSALGSTTEVEFE